MAILLKMLILTLTNANIKYVDKKLIKRSYAIKKALSTIPWIKPINKKKCAKVALNEKIKAFLIYVSFLSLGLKITIHPVWKA